MIEAEIRQTAVGQRETKQLNEIIFGTALTSAICTVAELGVADHIRRGSARPVRDLAEATSTLEGPLYRLMRLLASHGLFTETRDGEFDHTALSEVLRSDAQGRLLVVECVVPSGNGRSISKEFDITMMNLPGGLERTEDQFRTLFARAGVELSSITTTATMVSIAEGHPLSLG